MADIIAAHGAFVNAQIQRVLLTDDRFAQHGRRDRNPGLADQLEQLVLQAEAVHFHVGQNDRLARVIDHFLGLGQSGAQAFGVAALVNLGRLVRRISRHQHLVPRQLDINRAFEAQGGVQHAIDFLERSLRIAQDRGTDC